MSEVHGKPPFQGKGFVSWHAAGGNCFHFSHHLPCQDVSAGMLCCLHGSRARRLRVWLLDPSLILLTSFIIISDPLFNHLLLTQRLGEWVWPIAWVAHTNRSDRIGPSEKCDWAVLQCHPHSLLLELFTVPYNGFWGLVLVWQMVTIHMLWYDGVGWS